MNKNGKTFSAMALVAVLSGVTAFAAPTTTSYKATSQKTTTETLRDGSTQTTKVTTNVNGNTTTTTTVVTTTKKDNTSSATTANKDSKKPASTLTKLPSTNGEKRPVPSANPQKPSRPDFPKPECKDPRNCHDKNHKHQPPVVKDSRCPDTKKSNHRPETCSHCKDARKKFQEANKDFFENRNSNYTSSHKSNDRTHICNDSCFKDKSQINKERQNNFNKDQNKPKQDNGNHYGQLKEKEKQNNGNHYGQYKEQSNNGSKKTEVTKTSSSNGTVINVIVPSYHKQTK